MYGLFVLLRTLSKSWLWFIQILLSFSTFWLCVYVFVRFKWWLVVFFDCAPHPRFPMNALCLFVFVCVLCGGYLKWTSIVEYSNTKHKRRGRLSCLSVGLIWPSAVLEENFIAQRSLYQSLFHSNINFVLGVSSVLGRNQNRHYKDLMRDVWVYWDFWLFSEVIWQIWKQFDTVFRCLCAPEMTLLGTFSQKKHQRSRRLQQNSQFALHLNLMNV